MTKLATTPTAQNPRLTTLVCNLPVSPYFIFMITHIIHKAYKCQQLCSIKKENVYMYVIIKNALVVINSKPAFHAFSYLIIFQ